MDNINIRKVIGKAYVRYRLGIRPHFAIVPSETKHGNYCIVAILEGEVVGYLYPDRHIYKKVDATCYFKTVIEAEQLINSIEEDRMSVQNAQLKGVLNNTLSDFVSQKKMFTAHDVTQKIRNENPSLKVFHSTIKEYVHDQFENNNAMPGWDRTLIDVGQPNPWLYYLKGVHDPAKYGSAKPQTKTVTPKVTKRVVLKGTFGGIKASS